MQPVVEPERVRLAVFSRRILNMAAVPVLLGGSLTLTRWRLPCQTSAVLGWGLRPWGQRALKAAQQAALPFVCLEDGFLRSFGAGQQFAPLSLVIDETGIYYDSTRPSALEILLNGPEDLLGTARADVQRAKALLATHQLSKYNHAPPMAPGVLGGGVGPRVLVVDQTFGDLSVRYGGADGTTFQAMLAAARAENPLATIYVKTHPETTTGHKGGYLTQVRDDVSPDGQRTVVLRSLMNPVELVSHMDRVYVVSSTLGFEALLAGKPVTCFGLPWYAGWGATDDRQTCARRTRQRSVDELFAAAYFHYTRYLNPETQERGTIFDVITWLVRQREMAGLTDTSTKALSALPNKLRPRIKRLLVVGFAQWRRHNLAPLLSQACEHLHFVRDSTAAAVLAPCETDALVYWGAAAPAGLATLARDVGAQLLRMEDGFVRGVGLGSDLLRPLSFVLDSQGLYLDPTGPSDLEHLLANAQFSQDELERARRVRVLMVQHGITKYNLEDRQPARWLSQGRPVVLVPGQVEDDASIRLGSPYVKSNQALLQAAREACPGAFIVYKPHPDVVSRNRKGRVALAQALQWADHVELSVSVVSCIEACDEVHTMTSLAGFDALLREKRVVTYGQPFYAGWGLTHDAWGADRTLERRRRKLSLDELVAGALLRYPLYWDWTLNGFTTCEAVLAEVLRIRRRAQADGLSRLRNGWLLRQWRKLSTVTKAWTLRA